MEINDINKEKQHLSEIASSQQESASNPAYSVWVEASAGTGKTKVLSDRVLRLLIAGTTPSRILCLTYTKAAAVNMKERIYRKLSSWAVAEDKDLENELKELYNNPLVMAENPSLKEMARTLFAKVLDAPQPIKIQTIHGFCEEILKKFPLEAGVSPYFEIMDDFTSQEILDSISQKMITQSDEQSDENIKSAVTFLTDNVKEYAFSEILQDIVSQRRSFLKIFSLYPDVSAFLTALRLKMNLKDEVPTQEKAVQRFVQNIDKNTMMKCAEALMHGTDNNKTRAEILKKSLMDFDLASYQSVFLNKDGGILGRMATKDAAQFYPPLVLTMNNEALRLMDLNEELKSIKLYHTTEAIAYLAQKLIKEYSLYKKQRACLDYEDLIVLTRKLLENSENAAWVLYKLDGGIDHVLIDEAQDTSSDQWAIIKALTDEFFAGFGQTEKKRTIFAVGDRKQSIYGFQGASPAQFDEMRRLYEKTVPDFKTVHLDVSFRSTSAVLDMVNALFALDDAKKGVADETNVKHLPYRKGESGKIELWPIPESAQTIDSSWKLPIENMFEETAKTKLAEKIASKIQEMVSKGEVLESTGKPLTYRDFMVLTKRRQPFMNEFIKACKLKGVPVTGLDRLKLLDDLPIKDLISLMRWRLFDQDDLSLAEVLKSPLFNLTDDDLFKLCYQKKQKTLWERLKEEPEYKNVVIDLSELLHKTDYIRPLEFLNKVLVEMNGRKKFYSRFGFEAKDAIDEFMNLTATYEKTHIPSLQNFVSWLEVNDMEIKRELEQPTLNAVRLMTVHASKGLQAPIVILPDTTQLSPSKREASFVFDDDLFYYPLNAGDYDVCANRAHEKNVQKELDEYRRLLYVALTRAEDRLYIAGFNNTKQENRDKNWYELCHETLSAIGKEDENRHFVFESQQVVPVSSQTNEKILNKVEKDESFAFQKALPENPLSKPYTPSDMDDTDLSPVASPLLDSGKFYKRGTLIHKLLQLLPAQDILKQKRFIKEYLQKETSFSPIEKKNLETEVLNVLDHKEFSFIFSKNSRAEVPVMGISDGKFISGQIDRLIVDEKAKKVIVVDFKTNRPAASDIKDVPQAYITQLAVYKNLMKEIYKDMEVETYILWTNTLKLMKI